MSEREGLENSQRPAEGDTKVSEVEKWLAGDIPIN